MINTNLLNVYKYFYQIFNCLINSILSLMSVFSNFTRMCIILYLDDAKWLLNVVKQTLEGYRTVTYLVMTYFIICFPVVFLYQEIT